MDVHVGARLRELRRRAGLSKAEVAAALGVETSQLTKYERAENRLPAGRLPEVARCFGVDVDSLFPPITAASPEVIEEVYWRTAEGRALLDGFRAAPPDVKRRILQLVLTLADGAGDRSARAPKA